MNVEIYSKTNCVFCDKAKMRLANENPKIHMLDKDFTRDDFFEKFKDALEDPEEGAETDQAEEEKPKKGWFKRLVS